MAGRRITNNSELARKKREHMRRLRESMKERPVQFNPKPLAQIIQQWSRA